MQQSGSAQLSHPPHHHHHYPHLHLHGAGSFLRDNFVSSSASSALNAIMGHHHHQHQPQQQQPQPQQQAPGQHVANFSASPITPGGPVGSVSAGGSHSAGVVGCISFSTSEAGPLTSSNGSSGSSVTPTPPLQRRLAKSFSVAPSITQQKGAIFVHRAHVVLFRLCYCYSMLETN